MDSTFPILGTNTRTYCFKHASFGRHSFLVPRSRAFNFGYDDAHLYCVGVQKRPRLLPSLVADCFCDLIIVLNRRSLRLASVNITRYQKSTRETTKTQLYEFIWDGGNVQCLLTSTSGWVGGEARSKLSTYSWSENMT